MNSCRKFWLQTIVIGRVGGPGTFWDGYEYPLGTYPCYWIAYLRGWIHVKRYPYRAVRFKHPSFKYTRKERGFDY
jgi:hypothetical protein